jgi:hypothetical protein
MLICLVEPIVRLGMFLSLLSLIFEGSMGHMYDVCLPNEFGPGSDAFR